MTNYRIKNKLSLLIIRIIDILLSPLHKKSTQKIPKRILLANGAHLGDVLIATQVIPSIKKKYPDAEIGFLSGSWSKQVLLQTPNIDHIHIFDHIYLNRSSKNIFQHLKTRKKALQEIKALSYDMAIDLYSYFPNCLPLLWVAKIPTRIGFTSGGFGPLLTQKIDWIDKPVFESYKNLLPYLEKPPSLSREKKEHITLHISSGHATGEWPIASWKKLIESLQHHKLIFTGKGKRERLRVEEAIQGFSHCENRVDQLSWKELAEQVSTSRFLICVDTGVMHLAAIYSVPTVVIFSDQTDPLEWKPNSDVVYTFSNDVDPSAICEVIGEN